MVVMAEGEFGSQAKNHEQIGDDHNITNGII